MNRSANHAFAALAAFMLGLGSISAIVIVPPAEAAVPVAITTAELA